MLIEVIRRSGCEFRGEKRAYGDRFEVDLRAHNMKRDLAAYKAMKWLKEAEAGPVGQVATTQPAPELAPAPAAPAAAPEAPPEAEPEPEPQPEPAPEPEAPPRRSSGRTSRRDIRPQD